MGHRAMAADLRRREGKVAFERFKRGDREFLRTNSFQAQSLIVFLKGTWDKENLREIAKSHEVHPEIANLAKTAILMLEGPMK